MTEPLEFAILGPFEVRQNGGVLPLPAGKPRELLALLLLHRNDVVPADALVEELWAEPPATAAKNVQVYVSHLRKALGDGALVTRAPGYVLRVDEGRLDADRFRSLVEEARQLEPRPAAKRLREALALWRGSPLLEFGYESFAQDEIRDLEELRLSALEERIDVDLALGRHEDVVPELEALVRANPLRERPAGLLMVALYRCGRQAEALDTYRATRRRLVDELGLEPSPELQRLERAILEHEPSLTAPARVAASDAAAAKGPSFFRARRGRLLVASGVIVLAAAAAAAVVRLSEGGPSLRASPNSVAVIGGGNRVGRVIGGFGALGGIADGTHAIWVTSTANDFLVGLDPASGKIEDRILVGRGPTSVAVGGGEVWVVNQLDRTVSEVNARAGRVVGNPISVGNGANAIAFRYGSVWVANALDDTLTRIDANRGVVTKTIPLAGTPEGIAAGLDGVWVTTSTGQLLFVDRKHNRVSVAKSSVGTEPTGVAVGGGSVWVTDPADRTVSRFQPGTGNLTPIQLGGSPAGVAYGDDAVWVTNRDGTVSRIDPKKMGAPPRRIAVGNEPSAIAVRGRDLWTTVLPSPASHRGGTLRVFSFPYPGSLGGDDPVQPGGLSQQQMLSLTNDGLVTYRRIGGLAGDELVADLATGFPEVSDSGRTYTFHVHSGIRYSNGDLVRPQDFRRAIERVFTFGARHQNNLGWFYSGILGGKECEHKRKCDLSRGIVTDDAAYTVTFHLTKPDPEFLYKLAFPAADAVPRGTPKDRRVGTKPLPATGPYKTQSFSPKHTWTLVRNPRFHQWSAEAQPAGYPDRIVMTQYRTNQSRSRAQVVAVKDGSADVLFFPPLTSLGTLNTRYTNQLHSDPLAITQTLAMNTRVAPFDKLDVRRALNYAIDRGWIVQHVGGPLMARPTCQYLPPTKQSYRPYCPYTTDPNRLGTWTAPDLAKAERLVRASGTRGMKVTVVMDAPNAFEQAPKIGGYLVRLLDRLGYQASLKFVDDSTHCGPYCSIADSPKRAQIGWVGRNQFFSAAPSEFLDDFTCSQPVITADAGGWCSRRLDAQIGHATALLTSNPAAAGKAWTRIDQKLADLAPMVWLYNVRAVTLLSRRVGNYQYHPWWWMLLDQVWVR